ncbi:MAG TPA: hypothetical protein PK307_09820 [Spirochaetota bacterium]|nr:hypothetical protein [Spirochaetota bacterium]HPN13423.1 hypothetical protein [Spirochaetota bacterium]HQL82488.1 hypothetical protein [Spirochaetota bacterium]
MGPCDTIRFTCSELVEASELLWEIIPHLSTRKTVDMGLENFCHAFLYADFRSTPGR